MAGHDGALQVPDPRVKVVAGRCGSSSCSCVGWSGGGEAYLLSLGVPTEELEAL
jgi:hypothetical protein